MSISSLDAELYYFKSVWGWGATEDVARIKKGVEKIFQYDALTAGKWKLELWTDQRNISSPIIADAKVETIGGSVLLSCMFNVDGKPKDESERTQILFELQVNQVPALLNLRVSTQSTVSIPVSTSLARLRKKSAKSLRRIIVNQALEEGKGGKTEAFRPYEMFVNIPLSLICHELDKRSEWRAQASACGMHHPFQYLVSMHPLVRFELYNFLEIPPVNHGSPHEQSWRLLQEKARGIAARTKHEMQQLISTPVLGNWETALRVVRTILERHSPDVFSEISQILDAMRRQRQKLEENSPRMYDRKLFGISGKLRDDTRTDLSYLTSEKEIQRANMAIAQTQVCILLSLSSLLHSALFNTHGSLIEEMVTNEASNKLKNKLKDSLSDWPEEVIPRLMQYLVELALISIVRRRKCLDDNLRLVKALTTGIILPEPKDRKKEMEPLFLMKHTKKDEDEDDLSAKRAHADMPRAKRFRSSTSENQLSRTSSKIRSVRKKKDEKVAGSSAPTPAPPAEPNALHNAVKRRDISLLSKIVRTMIDIDEKDANKQTALHLACSKDFEKSGEMIRILLDSGATIDIQDRNGWTAFHYCCRFGSLDACFMLLSHFEVKEWDVGAVNNDGTSPLHYLARRQVPDHQKALYEETLAKTADKGAEIDSPTASGETPLHHAAMSRNVTATKFLLERGADPSYTNKFGDSPLQYARKGQYPEIGELLEEAVKEKGAKERKGGEREVVKVESPAVPSVSSVSKRKEEERKREELGEKERLRELPRESLRKREEGGGTAKLFRNLKSVTARSTIQEDEKEKGDVLCLIIVEETEEEEEKSQKTRGKERGRGRKDKDKGKERKVISGEKKEKGIAGEKKERGGERKEKATGERKEKERERGGKEKEKEKEDENEKANDGEREKKDNYWNYCCGTEIWILYSKGIVRVWDAFHFRLICTIDFLKSLPSQLKRQIGKCINICHLSGPSKDCCIVGLCESGHILVFDSTTKALSEVISPLLESVLPNRNSSYSTTSCDTLTFSSTDSSPHCSPVSSPSRAPTLPEGEGLFSAAPLSLPTTTTTTEVIHSEGFCLDLPKDQSLFVWGSHVVCVSHTRESGHPLPILWRTEIAGATSGCVVDGIAGSPSLWIGSRGQLTHAPLSAEKGKKKIVAWPAHGQQVIKSCVYLPAYKEVWTCGERELCVWDPITMSALATLPLPSESHGKLTNLSIERTFRSQEIFIESVKGTESKLHEMARIGSRMILGEKIEKKKDKEKEKKVIVKSLGKKDKQKRTGRCMFGAGMDGYVTVWDSDTRSVLQRYKGVQSLGHSGGASGKKKVGTQLLKSVIGISRDMRGDCRIWGGGGDRLSVWSSVEDVKMSEIYRSLKQNPSYNLDTHLLIACAHCDLEMVHYLVEEQNANIHCQVCSFSIFPSSSRLRSVLRLGDTPLIITERLTHREVTNYLMERQREEAEQVARLRCQPTEGRKFMSLPFQRESRKPRVNLDRVASNSSSPPPLPQTKSSFSLKPQSPSPGSSPSSAMPHTSSAENVSGMGSSPLNFGEMPSQFETQKFSLQQPQSISRPNSVPSPLPPTSPSNSGGDSALPETDSSFSLQQEASSPRSPPHPAESSSPTPCSPSVTRQTHSPSPPPSPSSSPFSSPKPHRPSPRLVVPKKKTGQSPAPSRSVSPHPPSPNQLRSSSTPASQVLQETEGNTENKEENKVVENKVVEIKVENKGGEQGKEIEKKEGQEGQTLDLSTVTPIDIYTEIRQLFTDSYAAYGARRHPVLANVAPTLNMETPSLLPTIWLILTQYLLLIAHGVDVDEDP